MGLTLEGMNLEENREDMKKFLDEFSKWLKEHPEPMRELMAWVRERPKLRRRISRRRPPK